MKFKFLYIIVLVFSGAINLQAQELLTLEQAVRTALENNYNVRLVANDLRIDKNNVTPGNAGFLPSVTGNLINSNSVQSGTRTSNNNTFELKNAKNSSVVYGLGMSWTVFDGFSMFAKYDQLKEFERLGEQEVQITILSTVGDVISTYYDLVQQQQQLRAIDTAIAISRLRVQNAKIRHEVGRAAKLEVLNAQVDLNTDTTTLLRQKELFVRTQILLNEILARDVNTRFTVSDTFLIETALSLDKLTESAQKQNPELQAALISKRIAQLDLQKIKGGRMPFISLNAGYNFNRSVNSFNVVPGQIIGRGPSYGVTAGINIFNGFNQRRNESNAKIQIESSNLQFERLEQRLKSQLASAYQTYLTSLTLVELESSNQQVAKQNLDITLEKYKLGAVTPLEIREAQLNYVNATVRFTNSQYQAKIAEVSLKEIAGTLQP